MSLRDTILASKPLGNLAVDVPEWNTTVYVKRLRSIDIKALEGKTSTIEDTLLEVVVDENGEKVFKPEDKEFLCNTASIIAMRLITAWNNANADSFSVKVDEL